LVEYPDSNKDKKIWRQGLKYVMMDDELYQRTIDGLLLKCLGEEEADVAMGEVHEGLCGSHQSAPKMKWMLKRAALFWPTMRNDCIRYQKGCKTCERFGDIQVAPVSLLHPIVKPWPVRG
jgi:hypothetical protein